MLSSRATRWLILAIAISSRAVTVGQDKLPNQSRPKLEYQRWSGAINVPDPVALSVDNQGRVFVTQTQRRKIQDLDIRNNRDWIPDDVGLESVTEKRAFFHDRLAIGGDDEQQKRRVEDLNQDGHHDWRDLTIISEKIFRLVDNNADGTADAITTFAEDFKTEVTGIAAGVLAHDGHVWATIAPDVWKLHDETGDGVADSREIMATGFGLHIAYAGHDMHGLTVGPDGKVYWSIGDKGINVTTKDGKQFSYPNQGGVMRCNPDGSDFEVFAHGLRNVQEFAFDQYGNIFGVDNDADQPTERERFVAIVDGMDAGWRCNYQYRGGDFNPWTDEKLWQLAGEEHPAYIMPPIDHYMDGPAGFKFNPGTALSPAYKNFFFVTNSPLGHQYAFRVKTKGDSFAMVDAHEIGSGHAIIGFAFGPDGGLYGADWDGGYPLDQKGAVIRIDVPGAAELPIRKETQSLLAAGFDGLPSNQLATLLGHADMRVRLGAQFALVKKNEPQRLATILADPNAARLARLHCVWGLGQLARRSDGNKENETIIRTSLTRALGIDDWAVQAQAAKTLGESPISASQPLIGLLKHANLHVRVNAGLALARHPSKRAVDTLLQQADQLKPDQHYLRHSIVRALATCATADRLASQTEAPSDMRRLVCVVALRHQSSPLVARFLDGRSSWVATEAARAIHDDRSIDEAIPALAKALNQGLDDSSNRNDFFLRRAINANFRIGSRKTAQRLLEFAKSSTPSLAMRAEACAAIGDWLAPPALDRVDGRRRILPLEVRDMDREQIADGLAELAANPDTSIRVAAIIAARKLKVRLSSETLATVLETESLPIELRIQSLNSIVDSDHESASELVAATCNSPSNSLAVRAVELLAERYPKDALKTLVEQLDTSKSNAVRQACIAGLAKIGSDTADKHLVRLGKKIASQSINPKLMLDIAQAVRGRAASSTELAGLAKQIDEWQLKRADELKLGNAANAGSYVFSSAGGDRDTGKQIFKTNLQAQCSRCHRIGDKGSEIGPELTKIGGKRDANYILRSIVNPSGDIEPKYFTQSVIMDDGKVLQGAIKSEDEKETILVDNTGKEITVATDEIDEIIKQEKSLMPDMTTALTAEQVQDLVAYLSSLK